MTETAEHGKQKPSQHGLKCQWEEGRGRGREGEGKGRGVVGKGRGWGVVWKGVGKGWGRRGGGRGWDWGEFINQKFQHLKAESY